ncbi:hypothetical protein [Nocardiopsis dassonvillei]|uniref:hypothetical protein n=1 Tax=Nocardiopsis dassonvillei TaxID=2014 RepID=UPI003F57DB79
MRAVLCSQVTALMYSKIRQVAPLASLDVDDKGELLDQVERVEQAGPASDTSEGMLTKLKRWLGNIHNLVSGDTGQAAVLLGKITAALKRIGERLGVA